jgi:hypothetical protein
MTPDKHLTVVVFRKWPNKRRPLAPLAQRTIPGDVIALFPEIIDRPGFCESYERVGQHGGAQYDGVMSRTRPATPDEYAALKSELESIGYRLDVKLRRPSHRQTKSRKENI